MLVSTYVFSAKNHLLLKVVERILEKVRNVFLQEVLVRGSNGSLVGGVDRLLDLARLNEVEHAGQKQSLRFEP
jgi:hypothetical protein